MRSPGNQNPNAAGWFHDESSSTPFAEPNHLKMLSVNGNADVKPQRMIVVPMSGSGDGAAATVRAAVRPVPGSQSGPGGAGQVVAFRRLLEPCDPRAALGDPAVQDGQAISYSSARGLAVVLLDYAPSARPLVADLEKGHKLPALLRCDHGGVDCRRSRDSENRLVRGEAVLIGDDHQRLAETARGRAGQGVPIDGKPRRAGDLLKAGRGCCNAARELGHREVLVSGDIPPAHDGPRRGLAAVSDVRVCEARHAHGGHDVRSPKRGPAVGPRRR